MGTLLHLAHLNWPARFIRSKSQWASVRCLGTSCLVWGANSRQTWHVLLDTASWHRPPPLPPVQHYPVEVLKISLPWPITGRQQVCGHSDLITNIECARVCMTKCEFRAANLNGTEIIKLSQMLHSFYVCLLSQSSHWTLYISIKM